MAAVAVSGVLLVLAAQGRRTRELLLPLALVLCAIAIGLVTLGVQFLLAGVDGAFS